MVTARVRLGSLWKSRSRCKEEPGMVPTDRKKWCGMEESASPPKRN